MKITDVTISSKKVKVRIKKKERIHGQLYSCFNKKIYVSKYFLKILRWCNGKTITVTVTSIKR